MIKKVFMRENLSFKIAELEIEKGLTVFTGLSGAGKSILFKGIISAFALCDSEAKFVEIELDDEIEADKFGIFSDDDNVFKMIKEKNAKYFLNNQSINKKSLNALSKTFIKYLSVKDSNEFSNERLLGLLDVLQEQKDGTFKEFLSSFKELYKNYKDKSEELEKIKEEEKRIEDLKELASMQIEKIEKIKPKLGEYEELLSLKKRLSKKDKIIEAWARANAIFELESAVIEALNLSEKDSAFFTDCLNELRFVSESQNFDDLDFDIEELLDRIEQLSFLIKKYGSIEESLKVLEEKKKELLHYENLSFEKKELELELENLSKEVNDKAEILSKFRKSNLKDLQTLLNSYLEKLYMKNVSLELLSCDLSELGFDELKLSINEAELKNLSSGELNRLRLAFIAVECKLLNFGKGIIFLDEIDANLSGKEAMSIANVLDELANFYQIFAISHLPQLSSKAKNHFLVEKENNESFVRKLKDDERVGELARMISGEQIRDEALEFAKTLLKS